MSDVNVRNGKATGCAERPKEPPADRKREVLKQVFGYESFRDGQETLIDAILAGRDAFGVMPTGGGKSLCYELPAILSDGVTFVVSPLISLMKDQVRALAEANVPAAYINSSLSPSQIALVLQNLATLQYRIVFIAPERLANPAFLNAAKAVKTFAVVVDEAHCVSQWGNDFRPAYLQIASFVASLPVRPAVAAFTATATERVKKDIVDLLALRDPVAVTTGFDRPNLHFSVLTPKSKIASLGSFLRKRPGESGIVYCSTRRDVEAVCEELLDEGFAATRYHAGLAESERRDNQDDFLFDRKTVMVATNAFGMGIDKSNVSFVVHYNMPGSLEAYYQEAGRAGRDGSPAECVLYYSPSDVRTARFFIEHPSENDALTEEERAAVKARDEERLEAMLRYCRTKQCLRGAILSYFGESHPGHCGNCGNCEKTVTRKDVTVEAQMILSCVKRITDKLGYPVGRALVVRTLHGSKECRVFELGLDSLSTYALMCGLDYAYIREVTQYLTDEGYLAANEHGGLALAPKARGVLFGGEQIFMDFARESPKTAAGEKKKKRRTEKAPTPSGLYDALRAKRAEIAEREHVPAYIVFTNASLADMANKMPRSIEEFLAVTGVGNARADRYGETFLAVIDDYLASFGA